MSLIQRLQAIQIPKSLRSLWLLVPLLVIAVYLLGQWNGKISRSDQLATKNSIQVLKAGKAFRERIRILNDSIVKVGELEKQAINNAAASQERTIVLKAANDSLKRLFESAANTDTSIAVMWARKVIAHQDSIIAQDVITIQNLNNAVSAVDLKFSLLQSAFDSSQVRIVSLENALKNQVKVNECKILFINCPSRVVSFFVGAAVLEGAHIAFGGK